MTREECLKILIEDIHSTVIATIDDHGHPVTRVIDIMYEDGDTFYFMTGRGKDFYEQLKAQKYISLTGMAVPQTGDAAERTMGIKTISIHGEVEETEGYTKLLLDKNPYMYQIYPDEYALNKAAAVFRMTNGEGDYFDMSAKPVVREKFRIGDGIADNRHFYQIGDTCTSCGKCAEHCPQKCIIEGSPYRIDTARCFHCGVCVDECPVQAIRKVLV